MKTAVLIPCYNEEKAIASVVKAFRAVLPDADIYVYDNNSKDRTSEVAREAGAIVRQEPLQGKGNVVRRMFADVEADIYVMTDGDETYHAPSAPLMIAKLIDENLDMVVGSRLKTDVSEAFRAGHHFGNRLLTGAVSRIFGDRFRDMLSGYRVFSRRFVKSFPAVSAGFETETELAVHALSLRMPVAEVETPYGARPEGSTSKLRTYRDGFRILWMIGLLFKEEKPLAFFSLTFLFLAIVSSLLAVPVLVTFLETGLVPRMPTALLSTGVMLLGFLSLVCGFILDNVTRGRREFKRLVYLTFPAPAELVRRNAKG
ncbi:glycosyltransferase [Telmatospirillum sp.]|uniref:glycosyltransferase family 2 protein n=1 Tax=Telmatospirillum sp. TaxID=2079197 RepID=UPI00284543A7|nr:glycosyltransferase [Telmatospirillum sp.]MDR3439319.1 glycosyltransferase [Telmatospirillum sp.]